MSLGFKRLILIIAHSSTTYSVARQQCKGKQLLHFHGNNEHFRIVDSYSNADNKNGTYYCVAMATVVTRTRHDVMLHTHIVWPVGKKCLLLSYSDLHANYTQHYIALRLSNEEGP